MRNRLVCLMFAAMLGLVPTLGAQEVVLPVCHKDCVTECAPACPAPCKKCVTECAPACPAPCKKCVPIEKTKVVEKVVYGSRCEDFCLPRCSGCFGGCSKKSSCDSCNGCATGCNDGTCHKCGKVKTRKFLMMKVQKHEECVAACEVVSETCAPKTCAAPCASSCTKTVVNECPSPAIKTGPGAEKLPISPTPEKKMPPIQPEKK